MQSLIRFAPSLASWILALAAQVSGYTNPVVALALAATGVLLLSWPAVYYGMRWLVARRAPPLRRAPIPPQLQRLPAIAPGPKAAIPPDAAKLAAINEVYEALDRAERVYDHGCDEIGGRWRVRIRERGPRAYTEDLVKYRSDVSEVLRAVLEPCRTKFGRFGDIHQYGDDGFREANQFFEPLNLFIENGLKKLPENCTEDSLDLIEHRAEPFIRGIGVFGTWVRNSKKTFREMRQSGVHAASTDQSAPEVPRGNAARECLASGIRELLTLLASMREQFPHQWSPDSPALNRLDEFKNQLQQAREIHAKLTGPGEGAFFSSRPECKVYLRRFFPDETQQTWEKYISSLYLYVNALDSWRNQPADLVLHRHLAGHYVSAAADLRTLLEEVTKRTVAMDEALQ